MKGIKTFFSSNRGSTPVIIICTTIIIVLGAAIATDFGYEVVSRYKLSYDTKNIAAAGVKELEKSGKGNIKQYIYRYAVKTVNDFIDIDIKILNKGKKVTVKLDRPFKYIFLKALGIRAKKLTATASAEIP